MIEMIMHKMKPAFEENYSKSPLARELKPVIYLSFSPWGLNNAQLLRDSQTINFIA